MEGPLLQPRDLVLQYGVLPPSVFAPQLDCVGSVQAAHRSLVAVATTSADGQKVVSREAVSSVLDMPAEQSQLLLDMVAAVSNRPNSSTAGGVDVYQLSLLLMAQLYKRETQKPETADHWPEVTSSGGSPINASNSRILIKQQLQQQRRQQQACSRGYADFLQKHQIALLELIMDDSSTAEAWQQQRATQIQQHKAAQLQIHEPQDQQQPQQTLPGQSAEVQEQQQQQQEQQGVEAEMTPADEDPAAEPAPQAAAAAAAGESMQSSPTRQTSDHGVSSSQQQHQQQLDGAPLLLGQISLGSSQISLGRTGNAAVPPVEISAVEFDRLGFLLEVVTAGARHQAGRRSSGGGLAAEFAAAVAAAAAGDRTSSSSSRLSEHVPGYSDSQHLMMEDLVTWMNSSWLHIQQQQLAAAAVAAAHSSLTATAAPPADAPAAAGSDGGSSGAAGLSISPPSDSMMMVLGSSPPSTSLSGAAGAANLGMNGLLPAINTGMGSSSSPATPTTTSAAAAAVTVGLGGLSSIRTNAARGVVAVASGTVDDHGVSGVYRGTVIRGPDDVTRDEVTIQNCIECHIYILAPVKLARISNCTDCTVCIGAAGTLLRIDCCERLQLTAAAGQVLVVSCHSCCLHLGTPRQPALLGDCRFIKLAPYNTRYETLLHHLNAANIPTNQPTLWDQPLVISSTTSSSSAGSSGGSNSSSKSEGGSNTSAAQLQQQRRPGCSTPSSPHTHSSSGGGSDRRGGAGPGKAVVVMQPEEFLPLVVPIRGTSGPLAGGAAHPASTHWLPGSHKQQQGPLPPFPFPLPEPFDNALQQQYSVVTELRNRIRNSGLDESRRNQLQSVIQSYFREWLHSSGAIRQVYDLSKLEGDEYGPLGGSPPAALRDHSQL